MKNQRKAAAKNIPIRIDAALLERIKALSEKMGEPQSTVMRICMRIGLNAVEQLSDQGPALVQQMLQRDNPGPTATPQTPKKKVRTAGRFLLADDDSSSAPSAKGGKS